MVRRSAWLATAAVLLFSVLSSPLTILYTNDLHVRPERWRSLEQQIAAERELDPELLLVDGGDAWHDFRVPVYAVWGAEATAEWMTSVGYDAMAVGNHELYIGMDRLVRLAAGSPFPLLSANLRAIDGTNLGVRDVVRMKRGGVDVLVVGLTTAQYAPLFDLPGLVVGDAAVALALAIRTAGSVDVVLCVGHVPIDEAASIAQRVPEVDIFVTGHSHEVTVEPLLVGSTLIVQSGAFGHGLGKLTVDVTEGGVALRTNEILATEKAAPNLRGSLLRLAAVVLSMAAFLVWAL